MGRCRRRPAERLGTGGDQGFSRPRASLFRGPSGLTEIALAKGFFGAVQTVLCVGERCGRRLLCTRRAGGADGLSGVAHFLGRNAGARGQRKHQTGDYKPSPAGMLPAIHAIISDAAKPRQD